MNVGLYICVLSFFIVSLINKPQRVLQKPHPNVTELLMKKTAIPKVITVTSKTSFNKKKLPTFHPGKCSVNL